VDVGCVMVFDHDYDEFPELSNSQMKDFGSTSPHHQFTEDFDAVVVKVTDGDTVRLSSPLRDFTFPLRFLDINAKELSEDGRAAKDWLVDKLEGDVVRILINKYNRVGKYGRLLGKVLYNGMDVGQEMLYLGLAVPFGSAKDGLVRDIDYYVRGSFA